MAELTEQQKADLSKKRGAAAAQIKDPKERQDFVMKQGNMEGKGKLDSDTSRSLDKEADDTLATGGLNKEAGVKTYHKGTDYVPKTGPAILKKGEAVLKTEDADKYRKAKMNYAHLVKGPLAGNDADEDDKKPKKEIKEVRVRKGHGGKGHIVEHHHTRPEHHPMEEHVMSNMADLHKHMDDNMGTSEPDADDAGAASQQAAALGSISNAG